MNKFWQTLHYLNGSFLLFSSTNHPETDGQTDRVNKIVNQLLRKYYANNQLFRDEHISLCEPSYNSTYQDSIKASPFEIACGYEPNMIKKVNSWDLEDNKYSLNAEEFVRRVKLILQQTLDNIVKARRRQEKHHNKERRYFECKISD